MEPSSGGAHLSSSVFVVPQHTWAPLTHTQPEACFNCHMHIPYFKMPTLKHVWQLMLAW